MEFRFSLTPIFTQPIIKVSSNLLPGNFRGDRRTALETTTKISEIINTMGEFSAKAQGLSKPVTTAQKLRMSDQNLYLYADLDAGKNGVVIGLLKVGRKNLYVFDENGETKTVDAPCVLDFYIHESRQRSGFGKVLFEKMLYDELLSPQQLAIDRPSDKLLGFLKTHYGLSKSIPQMNNFVIYEGFFDDFNENNNQQQPDSRTNIGASPNTALFGTQFGSDDYRWKSQGKAAANIPTIQNSPVGRYAAPRPACSMTEIIHSKATPETTESKRRESGSQPQEQQQGVVESLDTKDKSGIVNEEIGKLHINFENVSIDGKQDNTNDIIEKYHTESAEHDEQQEEQEQQTNGHTNDDEKLNDREIEHINKPQSFHLNKMHTGLKNISYNVGMAVSPTNKMEFGREVNRPLGQSPTHDNTDAQSTVSSVGSGDGYTDQGYFDLKFYHNKLW